MDKKFAIKVGEFEGPFDLLLDLIERRKLHVSQISLGVVADDFLAYLEANREEIQSEELAEFLSVAATLMLIKSLSLLPTLAVTEEEKCGANDLEQRLALYQKIKSQSLVLGQLFNKNKIFFREAPRDETPIFTPTTELEKGRLFETVKILLKSLPMTERLPKAVVQKVISLEEVITSLAGRVQQALKTSFREFLGERKQEKVYVIVSFLGLLELVKQGLVAVQQNGHFQDIAVESQKTDVPRYL